MIDLKDVLMKYPECLDNSVRLRAILRDLYPGQNYGGEIFLIVAAYDGKIVEEIQHNDLDDFFVSRIADKLAAAYATNRDKAEAVIALWCEAYGAGVLHKQISDISLHSRQSFGTNETTPQLVDIPGGEEIKPTLNQDRAIHSDKSRIAVAAGPGTGKTRVLVERIVNLVKEKYVPEHEILALTFSSKAAKEMKERLKDRIGVQSYRIAVKTFHSFGLQVFRAHCDLLGYSDEFEILDSTARNRILREVLTNQHISKDQIGFFSQEISRVKNGGKIDTPQLKSVVIEYESRKKRASAIDFDDMIILPRKLLKTFPSVASEYQDSYSNILVDEVQDINSAQVDMLQMLIGPKTSLFVVGDDDQCIYEWRGAEPGYLQRLAGNASYEVIRLEDNFRSESAIVDLSSSLIHHNMNRIEKTIRGVKRHLKKLITHTSNTDAGSIRAVRLHSVQEEAGYITAEIQRLIGEGYKYRDIAVLLRSSPQIPFIEQSLEKAGIPFYEYGNEESAYDTFLPVLFSILDLKKKGAISKAINYPNRIMDRFQFEDACDLLGLDPAIPAYEAFKIIANRNEQFDNSDLFRSRYQVLTNISSRYSSLFVEEILTELYTAYQKEPTAKAKDCAEKLAHLKDLIEIAKEFDRVYAAGSSAKSSPLKEFLEYMTLSAQDNSADDPDQSAVNIMTCHKSKGLEFPIVFIPGVQVGIFPNDYFIQTPENVEAERRLFYVSMTRAIEKLYLTCYADPFIGKGFVKEGFMAEIPGITLSNK